MIRFLVLLAVLFAVVLGLQWIQAVPGEVAVTLGDTVYAVSLPVAALAFLAALALAAMLVWLARLVLGAPSSLRRAWRRRGEEKGRAALSRGLVAAAAGDAAAAESAAQEAMKRAPDAPLTLLLAAQAAQIKGDRAAVREAFAAMLERPETRLVGLRGLHVEAERAGEEEAARHYAEAAQALAPSPWAARALLRYQIVGHDWDGALKTLASIPDDRLIDRRTARRWRAVILAALARDCEDGDPERARRAALEAHELVPDLVPAAVVAARLLTRLGDVRRAARVLETAWKAFPHPEIAETYAHVRPGDSVRDRLERVRHLARLRPQEDEGRLALARAAIDARDWTEARDALVPIVRTRPRQSALLLMAEIEEGEHGDRGRAREWLARAVHAPRDPAWTADEMVLEEWQPVSPITRRIDAVEWKVPVERLAPPPVIDIGEEELRRIGPRPVEPPPAAPGAAALTGLAAAGAAQAPDRDPEQVAAGGDSEDEAEKDRPHAAATPPDAEPQAALREEPAGAPPPAAADEAGAPPEPAEPPRAGRGNGGDRPAEAASDPERMPEQAAPDMPRPPDDPGVEEEDEAPKRFRLF